MKNGIPEDIVELVLKSVEGPLTGEEQDAVDAWLRENPDGEFYARQLRRYAFTKKQIDTFERIDKGKAWERIAGEAFAHRGKKRRLRYWWASAAVVLFAVMAGVWMWKGQTAEEAEGTRIAANAILPGSQKAVWLLPDGSWMELEEDGQRTVTGEDGSVLGLDSANTLVVRRGKAQGRSAIRVPRGGEYRVVLADGTKVWVNSESELSFPLRFDGGERVVRLNGEAYFDVRRDTARPFVVETRQSAVRVLGTSFNVCSYEEDGVEQTTLVSGSVEVDHDGRHYRLEPGEQLETAEGKEPVVRKVKTRLFTSWKDGMFRFADMPLAELTVKLSRWYDVNFVFEDEASKKSRFSGAVWKDVDFYEFLELIESTTHVHFEVRQDSILIRQQ